MTIGLLTLSSLSFHRNSQAIWYPQYADFIVKRSIQDVLDLYNENVENRLHGYFERANVQYPPDKITLIAFKDRKVLNLWAKNGQNKFTFIKTFRIKGASGKQGPKLKEGDRQVPEGIYKIEGLNPNSSFHLSMKLNYPNQFDLKYAKLEGRKNPGSNIFIHGKSTSTGCLAMGDKTIEELFILSHKVGLDNIEVIIAPTNLAEKTNMNTLLDNKPFWVAELYKIIKVNLEKYYEKPDSLARLSH